MRAAWVWVVLTALVMSIGCGRSSGPIAGPVDVGGPSFATPQV